MSPPIRGEGIITDMDLLIPRRPPERALPHHTEKQCTSRGPLGALPSLSLTNKGS